MIRLLVALSALAAAFPGSAVAQAKKTKPFFPYPLTTTMLPNGLSVTRVPFKSPGLVSYYSVVRVGSRNEVEPDHSGFAHFFEHMMFRGTKAFPGSARDSLLGKLGFKENAFAGRRYSHRGGDPPVRGRRHALRRAPDEDPRQRTLSMAMPCRGRTKGFSSSLG